MQIFIFFHPFLHSPSPCVFDLSCSMYSSVLPGGGTDNASLFEQVYYCSVSTWCTSCWCWCQATLNNNMQHPLVHKACCHLLQHSLTGMLLQGGGVHCLFHGCSCSEVSPPLPWLAAAVLLCLCITFLRNLSIWDQILAFENACPCLHLNLSTPLPGGYGDKVPPYAITSSLKQLRSAHAWCPSLLPRMRQ